MPVTATNDDMPLPEKRVWGNLLTHVFRGGFFTQL
jgi:hypothetical protein